MSLPGGVFTAAGAGVKTKLVFFTKGKPTKKVWYYDLTDVKVRKKTPLTMNHFTDFLERLPKFKDSELCWTVDIQQKRKAAADQSQPFKEQAAKCKQQAAQWKVRLTDLKKPKAKNKKAIEEAEAKVKQFTKEAREAENKAQEIKNAVYDLKAVHPNRKPVIDTRTPDDLLDIIEQKGKEIIDILKTLRTN